MPPKANQGQSSFALAPDQQQVVCPLKSQDGSNCRKRCLGEKRYRSMQEHIRRAHPEHYIPKLPATEASFQLMISTPPKTKEEMEQQNNSTNNNNNNAGAANDARGSGTYARENDRVRGAYGSPAPRLVEEQYPAAATAAVALAQLHSQRQDSEWGSEAVGRLGESMARLTSQGSQRGDLELPPMQNSHDQYNPYSSSPRPGQLLPSILARSPPGRSTTLPPIHRSRPRKSSLTQNARKPKHERTKSREHARRLSVEGRKAMSAEPPPSAAAAAVMNKRWEDLIEAATSANEAESDRDLTPASPSTFRPLTDFNTSQIPQSPPTKSRASLPPFQASLHDAGNAYKASPLQRALTPPAPGDAMQTEPFPSVESSSGLAAGGGLGGGGGGGGTGFHLPSSGLSADASPQFARPVQIYCAQCRRTSVLRESYACSECISGFCAECVYLLNGQGRPCPRCRSETAKYRSIQLDLR